LFSPGDDATVVPVRISQYGRDMAGKSLEDRVGMLEKKLGSKTLEEQFREEAELIDRRFLEVYSRFTRVDNELAIIRKDLGVVREGVSIILKKLG
jgi:hypothetical protein